MTLRATCVSQDPTNYFLPKRDEDQPLRISDVLLRVNQSHKDVFADMIRLATHSKWSHAALVYLLSEPSKGYDNMFLVEARTKGIHINSWRNEVIPYRQFTSGIKRLPLDWYVETPYEKSRRDPHDPKDEHGIEYLRHVRGIAVDQINGLFDHKTVNEIAALYVERAAKRHLSAVPQVAEVADAVAIFFKKWDAADDEKRRKYRNDPQKSKKYIARFICSGLIQYSFFEALRIRIINDMKVTEYREAAMSNLSNMQRVIFREDPEDVIGKYIRDIQAGRLDIAEPTPDDVLDLLKTAVPADFNNSPHLQWKYVIRKGIVWQIDEAPEGYTAQTEDEEQLLELMKPEHVDPEHMKEATH